MYHKTVQQNTANYLKDPHLFPQLIHTIYKDHSNDRYQNIKLTFTGNHFSHRQSGIIYKKTYSKQNQLVKINTFSPEMTQRLRLSFTTVVEKHRYYIANFVFAFMSDLNYDLLNTLSNTK